MRGDERARLRPPEIVSAAGGTLGREHRGSESTQQALRV